MSSLIILTEMLIGRLWFVLLAIALPLTFSVALGQEEKVNLSKPNIHKKLIKQAEANSEESFEKWIAAFRAHLDEQPNDVGAAAELCRFIEYHSYSDTVFYERAEEYLDEGEEYLKDNFDNNPIAELYFFEQLYGNAMRKRAEILIASETIQWTDAQLASIYLELATYHQTQGNAKEAGENALLALALNPTSAAQLIAAGAYLDSEKEKENEKGIEILSSEYSKEYPNQKKKRMLLLSQFGAHKKALELLEVLRKSNPKSVSPIEESEVWIRSNSVTKARQVFVSAKASYWDSDRLASAYFSFEKEHGNPIQTLNAYHFLRDQGFTKDPFLRHRISLFLKHPFLPWEWRDVRGLLAIVGVFVVSLCLPLLVISPAHYWGLLRHPSVKQNIDWKPNWGLRDAWRALAFFLFISTFLISYIFVYEEVFPPIFDEYSSEVTASKLQLTWMVLSNDIIMLLGLGIIAGFANMWRAYSAAQWSLGVSILFAIVGFIVLKIFGFSIHQTFIGGQAEVSFTIQSLQAVLDTYGPFTLILAVAVLTPIIEEVLFRGVLLSALAKHIPFWAANILQAGIFMVAHEDVQHFPFLFAFGIVCGVYRQRSGNLVACTLLHGINNGVVALHLIVLSNI